MTPFRVACYIATFAWAVNAVAIAFGHEMSQPTQFFAALAMAAGSMHLALRPS